MTFFYHSEPFNFCSFFLTSLSIPCFFSLLFYQVHENSRGNIFFVLSYLNFSEVQVTWQPPESFLFCALNQPGSRHDIVARCKQSAISISSQSRMHAHRHMYVLTVKSIQNKAVPISLPLGKDFIEFSEFLRNLGILLVVCDVFTYFGS